MGRTVIGLWTRGGGGVRFAGRQSLFSLGVLCRCVGRYFVPKAPAA